MLLSLYYTLEEPFLNYCVTAWGNVYQSTVQPLLKFQKKPIKIRSNCRIPCHWKVAPLKIVATWPQSWRVTQGEYISFFIHDPKQARYTWICNSFWLIRFAFEIFLVKCLLGKVKYLLFCIMLIGRPIVVRYIAIEKMRLISFLQSFIPTLFCVDNLLRNSFPFLYPLN